MIEAFIGFLVGVAGTYLAITRHQETGDADEVRMMLRELKREQAQMRME